MDTFHAIILGIVQGLTEFLPISSSGHLVIFQKLFGLRSEILFDCSVHIGTLIAVFIYFWKDIMRILETVFSFNKDDPEFLLAIDIVSGSIPTAIIGFLFKDYFERAFSSAETAGVMLILTGLIIGATRFFPEGKRDRVGILRAILIGISQAVAIIPGISRSGATISCGIMCGIRRDKAFRFSFLLSIPAIIGAFLLESFRISHIKDLFPVLTGTFFSAIFGLIALKILDRMIKKGHLYYFSPYCILVGILTTLYFSTNLFAAPLTEKRIREIVREEIRKNPKLIYDVLTEYIKEKREKEELSYAFRHRINVPIEPYNPSLGPKDAPITIIEFTDFECPFCKRATDTMDELMKIYDGKIRLVFKNLPLSSIHKNALSAAKAAMAAHKQGMFWPYHDMLFDSSPNLNKGLYIRIAKRLKLDIERFKKDMNSKEIEKEIKEDMRIAKRFGINATPSFLINGVLIKGAKPLSYFRKVINRLLSEGR